MNAFGRRCALRTFGALCALTVLAAPALAMPGVVWMIDPLTLPPALRAQALTAPLGDYDPFGQPADPGCLWSRLQVPTMQGLRWVDIEECGVGGLWD